MGLLEKVFSIFVLLMPIGELGRIQLGSIAFSINDIALILTLVVWLIHKYKTKSKFSYSLFKPIVIFLAIGLISLLLNLRFLNWNYFLISFLYLVRFALYSLIYFVLFDLSKKFKEKSLFFLSFSFAMIMIAGYIQFIFYPNLRNLYYLGWDEHLYRLFSTLLDPNFAGTILVLSFMLFFGLTIKFFNNKRNNVFFLFLLISIANLYEIYLTYSRSAIIMLFVSLICFLLLLGKKRMIFSIMLLLVAVVFFVPKSFQTEGTNLFRTASIQARVGSINNTLKIIGDNPIFGVGFNAYRYAQHRYGFLEGDAWQTTHSGAGTDNSFLFVFATTGISGLLSYLYLLFMIFRISFKKIKKIETIILVSSLAGLIINGFFINSLFYVFVMEWIWILAGLTESS